MQHDFAASAYIPLSNNVETGYKTELHVSTYEPLPIYPFHWTTDLQSTVKFMKTLLRWLFGNTSISLCICSPRASCRRGHIPHPLGPPRGGSLASYTSPVSLPKFSGLHDKTLSGPCTRVAVTSNLERDVCTTTTMCVTYSL